ncbi:16S rRNA (uracil(1498)-N(3))-methyltransferase [Panacibacter ginsenosidivorans]|uniref:Ribosomal RNA small subunit methyltransferase E n=1 Tax=Panacibacter ginsenosidivorans TaxID=1813871 RepID=A0A5B8VBA3_9BACT|nr:16S rRNA (uracil(1498)-N(3))-methyltransferase [Panacibacter ginsenosidivorans]QEC67946.1 16S rRNA (uracil(1498)-N(3))-methyltransferase [Panacibacter ginsenosidivorans]
MSLPYFFAEDLSAEDQLILPEDTSKHCIQVLRMQEGEQMVLTDGKGKLLTTTILNADRRHCAVKINTREYKKQNKKKFTIAMSLLKNTSRFEWFLEKATEIGIDEIIPLICKRTEKQYFRLERMQQIVISAMLQSQQAWLPILHEPTSFDKMITQSVYTTKLIAHCEEDKKKDITKINTNDQTIMLIGPEGDFTTDEITLALQNNYIAISLGTTRLRTETAGLVAAAFLKNLS